MVQVNSLIVFICFMLMSCNAGATELVRPLDVTRYGVECKDTVLIGFGERMNEEDMRAFNRAKFVCAFQYTRSPCLVKFERYGEHDYRATCGAGKKK